MVHSTGISDTQIPNKNWDIVLVSSEMVFIE